MTGDKYLVQTRAEAKSSRESLPEVHGVQKSIAPHVKPEEVVQAIETRTVTGKKPRLGQGRAGLRRKIRLVTPPPHKVNASSIHSRETKT